MDCVSPVWGNPKGTPEYSTNIGHISTAINKINVFVNMLIGCKSANEKSAYIIKISHVYHNTGSRCPYFINQHDTHFFNCMFVCDISELCSLGILHA